MLPPSTTTTAATQASRFAPWLSTAGCILVGLVLTVYFHTPVREVLTPALDPSNYASYAYFIAHGFQYGHDVIPMAGPYGFVMYGWMYGGELFWVRTAAELGLNAALAALTLWFFLHHRGSRLRWLWLAAHVAYTPFIEDLPIEWLLLLGGLFLIESKPKRGACWVVAVTALLAFLSLIKGTQIMLGFATIGVVLGSQLWQRNHRHAGLIAGSYVIGLVLFWTLAGQNPLHFARYLSGVLDLARGYNDAMSLEEPVAVFRRGVLVSLFLGLTLALVAWFRRRDPVTVAAVVLLAGHSFVQWKHGFVRADGHTAIYFHYAIVAASALTLIAWGRRREQLAAGFRVGALGLVVLTLAAASLGSADVPLPQVNGLFSRIGERLRINVTRLVHLSSDRATFDQELAAQRKLHAMPLTRHVVGGHSIDHFGFEHGLIPLNDLNYRPRPMSGGSFNVYTPALMAANQAFLRAPARRPDYYLFRLQTIDDRLAGQDDGLALHELLQQYEPILAEHDHLLLQARPERVTVEPRLIERRSFQIGDQVPVPPVSPDELLLTRFELNQNLLGRIRNFFYKVPPIRISLHGAGLESERIHRLVPAMARSAFVLSPFLERNRDWLDLFTDTPGRTVESFRISTRDRTWFDRTVTVEFFSVPRPRSSDPARISELRAFTETAVEGITTTQAGSSQPKQIVGLLAHPPTQLTWRLDGSERIVTFGYGFVPAAYAADASDGAEFFARLVRNGQPPVELFRQTLNPVRRLEDRGHHEARIALPPAMTAGQLIVGTTPGPAGDTGWDWTYVSDLNFERGRYRPEQFPGFDPVPVSVNAPVASVIASEGAPLFMMHAPATLTFEPAATARTLEIEFGLLPGAYTGDGRTPGLDYVVQLIRAGDSPRELFRRALRPLDTAADRGPQQARIDLPTLQPGDRLQLSTQAGPTGSVDWSWAYVSRFSLQ